MIQCKPGWEPVPEEEEEPLTYLTNTLGLSASQVSFLVQYPYYQHPLCNFISQKYSSESFQIGKSHIDLLITDPAYVQFVNDHHSTGNLSVAWWMYANWLSNPQNFNLDPYDEYRELTAAEKELVFRHLHYKSART